MTPERAALRAKIREKQEARARGAAPATPAPPAPAPTPDVSAAVKEELAKVFGDSTRDPAVRAMIDSIVTGVQDDPMGFLQKLVDESGEDEEAPPPSSRA